MTEQWRTPISDGETYEDFEVSNLGRIKSLNYRNTGKPELMTPVEDTYGYFQVGLRKNGETKKCLVHRLVAETFLENPENKPCINHKIEGDEGKKINMVIFNEDGSVNKEKTTIEWVTYEENNNYATHNERMAKTKSKPVLQLSLSGDLIKEWESTRECGRNGFDHSAVVKCCLGKQKTHKGFLWMYADDYKEKQFRELGYVPLCTPYIATASAANAQSSEQDIITLLSMINFGGVKNENTSKKRNNKRKKVKKSFTIHT